jgi:tRNA (guanine-N7-)-methyltransferase
VSRTIQREIAGNDWRVWPEEVRRAGWSKLFGLSAAAPMRLHVDIGFGDGAFLTELARRDPGRSVVGIELSFKRVLKVAQRLSRSDLRNVRLLGVDAAWAIREAFADESVESFWINFPDPWPKRCHQRRRLVESGFVRELSRRMTVGGTLHIATDAPDYAEAIRSALDGEPLLEIDQAATTQLGERRELPPTRFQREWASKGRPCVFFHCRRAKALSASGMGCTQRAAS